jgi:hypothetical protein
MTFRIDEKKLAQKIEIVRFELLEKVNRYGLNNESTIKCSEKLDKLMVLYYKMKLSA